MLSRICYEHTISYLLLLIVINCDDIGLWEHKLNMPGTVTRQEDSYICVNFYAPNLTKTVFIKEIVPHVSSKLVHHMILRGCTDTDFTHNEVQQCGTCNLLLYAWAHNAPSLIFPLGVGLPVGSDVEIKGFQLEMHYLSKVDEPDYSGLNLVITDQIQPRIAGVFLLMKGGATIPPQSAHVLLDVSCRIRSNLPITLMAIRGHAHDLGRSVAGYRLPNGQGPARLLGQYNPQWPQAFYPIKQLGSEYDAIELGGNDIIMARCVYDSSGRDRETHIGATHHDEMCNLYLLYHTSPFNNIIAENQFCVSDQFEDKWQLIPETSKDYAPKESPISKHIDMNSTRLLSDKYVPKHVLSPMQIKIWNYDSLGQISGVTTRALKDQDPNHELMILHRGPNRWNSNSFNEQFVYQDDKSFLSIDPVLHLNPVTGEIQQMWGKGLFILPHSITLSYHKSSTTDKSEVTLEAPSAVWITDVALHQVMKFDWGEWNKPSLILGSAGQPGRSRHHFCQPSDVVVTSTGDILISDGYCNARIVKFSSNGTYLTEWSALGVAYHQTDYHNYQHPTFWSSEVAMNRLLDNYKPHEYNFKIVHSLTLIPKDEQKGYMEQVCAADRENAAILCYTTDGLLVSYYGDSSLQPSVYAIEYDPVHELIVGLTGKNYAVPPDSLSNTLQQHWLDPSVFFLRPIRLKQVSEIATIEAIFKYDNSALVGFASATGLHTPHDLTLSINKDSIYITEIDADRLFKMEIVNQEMLKYIEQGFSTTFVQKLTNFNMQALNSSQLIGFFILLLIMTVLVLFAIVRLCRFRLTPNNSLRHHVTVKNKLTPKRTALKKTASKWFKRSAKNAREVGFRPLIRADETPDYFAEGVQDEDDEDVTGEQNDEDVIMEPYKEQALLKTRKTQYAETKFSCNKLANNGDDDDDNNNNNRRNSKVHISRQSNDLNLDTKSKLHCSHVA